MGATTVTTVLFAQVSGHAELMLAGEAPRHFVNPLARREKVDR